LDIAKRSDPDSEDNISCVCNETAARVIAERRLRTFSELRHMAVQMDSDRACEMAVQILGGNSADCPFSLIYLLEEKRPSPRS
jgi:hypothetical protein